jgi:hypothetical protein
VSVPLFCVRFALDRDQITDMAGLLRCADFVEKVIELKLWGQSRGFSEKTAMSRGPGHPHRLRRAWDQPRLLFLFAMAAAGLAPLTAASQQLVLAYHANTGRSGNFVAPALTFERARVEAKHPEPLEPFRYRRNPPCSEEWVPGSVRAHDRSETLC